MTATMSQLAQTSTITNVVVENTCRSTEHELSSKDIGLIFVHEYYTFLSKDPNNIHAFYSHDSIMVRGNEAEDPVTAQGEEAIRRCLEETPMESTNVRLDSVDSVGSANNGILVQVLGDMVNSNIGVRRFSQTFFLATQRQGYYVLTDILRFLKEDLTPEETANQTNEQAQDTPIPDTTTFIVGSVDTSLKSSSLDNSYLNSTAATTASSIPAIESAMVNGEEAKAQEQKSVGETNEEHEETKLAAEDNNKPKAPKTWSSIIAAGTDAKKSSTNTAATPTVPESSAVESKSDSQVGGGSKFTQAKEQSAASTREPVPKEEQMDVFLKNVKNLTNEQIKEAFTAAIGEVKLVTIHNNRTTAFLTFATPESCQKALEQRHVDVGEVTVHVEERRPASSRPPRSHHNGGVRGEFSGERRFGSNRRGGGASRGSKPRGGGNVQK